MHWSWWVLGLGLGGCAEPAEAPTAELDGLPDVARVFGEVSRLRELPSTRVPRAKFLRFGEYRATLQRLNDEPQEGVAAYAEKLGLSAAHAAVGDEQARLFSSNGLYAQSDSTIYVLDDPSRRFPLLLEQVVAHESVHALQHQHGLLPAPHEQFENDEALARRALIEGDATLGMLLYEERNWRTPVARLAEKVRRGFAEEPISHYVGATSPELQGSPPYQQEMVLFPYRAGAAFVGALLAAGGYATVAAAFKAPPRSTAQILHPERYARGEQPVAVPLPTPPAGYSLAKSSVLGELLTRSLLLRCNSESQAIEAAEGWRGDTVAFLAQGANELVAQQWLMDSERDARELETALRVSCNGFSALSVFQRGSRVVGVRGGSAQLAAQLAAAWLSAPVADAAPRKPLGATDLLPLPPRRALRDRYVEANRLRIPAAGVELPVPKGFQLHQGSGELERRDRHASIAVLPLLGQYFEDAPRQILREVSRSMQAAIAFSNIVERGEPYPVSLRLGNARALDFEHEGTIARGRVIAIPRCGGAGLLAVVQYYGEGQENAENAAISSLSAFDDDPYCRALTH